MDFKSELIAKFKLIEVDKVAPVKAGRSYVSISNETHNTHASFFTPEEDYFQPFSENRDLYMFPVDTSDLKPGSIVKDIDGDLLVVISGGYEGNFYAEVTDIENTWPVEVLSIVEVLYRA